MEQETLKYAGERLKEAREAQNCPLATIAETTRISRKYLEEIEAGIAPKLPDTYIRAFVRAYAQYLNLDPRELLQERRSALPAEVEAPSRPSAPAVSDPATLPQPATDRVPVRSRQASVLLVLSILIVAGLIISVFLIRQGRRSPAVQEISFNQLIKEREAKMNERASPADTAAMRPVVSGPVSPPDSLVLEGLAKDSVWVRVVIDGARMRDYRLLPGARLRVKAEKYFTLSLGNANAIALTLGGESLGVLSPAKKPLWNVTLSRESLKKRQQSNVKTEPRPAR